MLIIYYAVRERIRDPRFDGTMERPNIPVRKSLSDIRRFRLSDPVPISLPARRMEQPALRPGHLVTRQLTDPPTRHSEAAGHLPTVCLPRDWVTEPSSHSVLAIYTMWGITTNRAIAGIALCRKDFESQEKWCQRT